MGILTEAALDELVSAGCRVCGARRLVFRAYLDGAVPVLAGEPVDKPRWVHDGEKFVDGVYEVGCDACKLVLFAEPACPRCHAAEGLARALAATNAYPAPEACPGCGGDELKLVAMIPARVSYERGRAEPPRTTVELNDPGFHGMKLLCADCGVVGELTDRCPLCAAPGPLRARPG